MTVELHHLDLDDPRWNTGWLSVDERARAARYRVASTFPVRRAALRAVLGERLGVDPAGVPLVAGPNGKPELAYGSVSFNASSSGRRALVAVSDNGPVGIDLEAVVDTGDLVALARRMFAPSELALVERAADPVAAFYVCWTRKEAVGKAAGVGLGGVDTVAAAGWRVEAVPAGPGFAAAVAVAV